MAFAQGQPLTRSLLERRGSAVGRIPEATTPPISRRLTAALVGQARSTRASPPSPGGIAPGALAQGQRSAQVWRRRTEIMEKRSGLALKRKLIHGEWMILTKGEKSLRERKSIGESVRIMYLKNNSGSL